MFASDLYRSETKKHVISGVTNVTTHFDAEFYGYIVLISSIHESMHFQSVVRIFTQACFIFTMLDTYAVLKPVLHLFSARGIKSRRVDGTIHPFARRVQ